MDQFRRRLISDSTIPVKMIERTKIKIIILFETFFFLIIVMFFATGCVSRRVETMSEPRTLLLSVQSSDKVQVQSQDASAEWVDQISAEGVYTVDIPGMRGGFSELFWIKYDIADPLDYPVVRLRSGDGAWVELSTRQIEALPHKSDRSQVYIIDFD